MATKSMTKDKAVAISYCFLCENTLKGSKRNLYCIGSKENPHPKVVIAIDATPDHVEQIYKHDMIYCYNCGEELVREEKWKVSCIDGCGIIDIELLEKTEEKTVTITSTNTSFIINDDDDGSTTDEQLQTLPTVVKLNEEPEVETNAMGHVTTSPYQKKIDHSHEQLFFKKGKKRNQAKSFSATNLKPKSGGASLHDDNHDINVDNHDIASLSTSTLAKYDSKKRKQIIGEHLYHAISGSHPDKAGKITGMLLEMDNSELIHMLKVPESLNSKVKEALRVLRDQVSGGASLHNPIDIVTDIASQSASALAQYDKQKRNQIIGEYLYRVISVSHPDKAGKITGMLLEMDDSDLLHMLKNPDSLNNKVEEALTVLRDYNRSTKTS